MAFGMRSQYNNVTTNAFLPGAFSQEEEYRGYTPSIRIKIPALDLPNTVTVKQINDNNLEYRKKCFYIFNPGKFKESDGKRIKKDGKEIIEYTDVPSPDWLGKFLYANIKDELVFAKLEYDYTDPKTRKNLFYVKTFIIPGDDKRVLEFQECVNFSFKDEELIRGNVPKDRWRFYKDEIKNDD